MSFTSPQVPKSATRIYGGIVVAVTTIAVSFIVFRKLWKTRNKSREKGISRQPVRDGPNPDVSIPTPTSTTPQPDDHSPGEELQDISVPSQVPPTTSKPQFIDKDARDERNPGISIPAQASITPRPHPVDDSSRGEGHPGVPVPPRGPPTASEPQTLWDRDAPNRGMARDSELGILIASPGINQPLEATNEDDDGIPNPIETLFIAPEHPSIDGGSEDGQSGEAARGVDTDSSIPKEAPSITTELHSVDREAPSMSFFQGSSNVEITGSSFYEVHGNTTIIRFGDGQFTDVQRNLICDYIANLTVLPDIKDNLKKHVLTQSIISLPRAKAVFNDYQNKKKSGPCFKGTREALLREMADWATGAGESRMYVLSGLAGIGKSTVAYTIASRAANLNLLGASFFFSRDEADRKNAEKFFSTIAYQLCVYNETFSKAIGDVLLTERGSAATTKDPQVQLQVLIVDPLRSIVPSCGQPILVIVDALDECNEDDEHVVVMGLRQLVQQLPSFKVILTTRPQPLINSLFGNHDGHKIFHLQDIEDKVVDGDIRLYLSHSFSQEQVRMRLLNPKEEWHASEEDIESLVRAAGRLFIIASTAVLYVLNKTLCDPGARMKKLLGEIALDRTPVHALNHFYSVIVRSAIQVDDNDDDIVDRYQIIVGTILVMQTPLPVTTLAYFIGEESEKIYAMLRNLQSVILLGGDDVPRIYHKSFPDYLTDQARCKDPHLRIDPRTRHTQIAIRCFEMMDKHLKRNILCLGDPARFMNNEDGLKEDGITHKQIQEKIPQQLRYACVYWINHFELANKDVDLMNRLEKFVAEHMLFWFEVLSLIGKLDLAHRAIGVVLKVLKSMSLDLHQLLSEALRFISKFYETIKRSALHAYYSALPFTPSDSLLYHRYIKEVKHNICTIEGGPEKWDALVATLSHMEVVNVIKFSLDSTLCFSCSVKYEYENGPIRIHNQGKLKIWDAATGTPVSTIPGHMFAVANDFSAVASSDDKTITFYEMNESTRSAMLITSSNIQRLALSSESSRVAAALSDGTVWLWESRSAKLIDNFDGFEIDTLETIRRLPWLQFSPTGTRLAYPSANGIFKLRDGISGRFIVDLRCGSSGCRSFEFSGDGSRIVSLSNDCGLTLWNSESGVLIGAVRNVGQRALAISADGSLLATGDANQVTLWSEKNDSLAQIEVLKFDHAGLMAFSLDNMLAIGSVFGIKLYDVKTHAFISTLPFRGMPTALALSPDCTHFAVGNFNGGVCLWDIRGLDASSPPSEEGATVTALAFSRDCSRLACGFANGTVGLWETSPTKQRIASHQAHKRSVRAIGFGPDGGLFASGSDDETTKLWNGIDGSLCGTLEAPSALRVVALSNSVLVAGHSDSNVTLWCLDTLSLIHTFKTSGNSVSTVSIADNGALIAVVSEDVSDGDSKLIDIFSNVVIESAVSLLDIVNRTTIATFIIPYQIHTMTFRPDNLNSQLVAQSTDGVYLSLDLINKQVTKGPPLEGLIQLPDTSLWHGVPVWHCQNKDQHYFSALFSRPRRPVPVLWIPRDLRLSQWTQGSLMIALGCRDGRVILLRPTSSHVG